MVPPTFHMSSNLNTPPPHTPPPPPPSFLQNPVSAPEQRIGYTYGYVENAV